jgi:nitric oxide reductase NorE protein
MFTDSERLSDKNRNFWLRGRVPGELGIWLLVIGEMIEFSLFFGAFLYSHADNPELFAQARTTLNQSFGLINTLLLLTSSLFVALGVHAARLQLHQIASRLIVAAGVCGLGFATLKVIEYSQKLSAGITPRTNDFFLYYYVFTGIHFIHGGADVSLAAAAKTSPRRE